MQAMGLRVRHLSTLGTGPNLPFGMGLPSISFLGPFNQLDRSCHQLRGFIQHLTACPVLRPPTRQATP